MMPSYIDECHALYPQNAHDFCVGDARNLSYVPSNSYNIVVSFGVLCQLYYLSEVEAAISEMIRICEPGGYIVVGFLTDAAKVEGWSFNDKRSFPKAFFLELQRRYGLQSIRISDQFGVDSRHFGQFRYHVVFRKNLVPVSFGIPELHTWTKVVDILLFLVQLSTATLIARTCATQHPLLPLALCVQASLRLAESMLGSWIDRSYPRGSSVEIELLLALADVITYLLMTDWLGSLSQGLSMVSCSMVGLVALLVFQLQESGSYPRQLYDILDLFPFGCYFWDFMAVFWTVSLLLGLWLHGMRRLNQQWFYSMMVITLCRIAFLWCWLSTVSDMGLIYGRFKAEDWRTWVLVTMVIEQLLPWLMWPSSSFTSSRESL